jgi:hypothetical protein
MTRVTLNSERAISQGHSESGIDLAPEGGRTKESILAGNGALVRETAAWIRKNFAREIWDWMRCDRVILPSVKQFGEVLAALETSNQVYESGEAESPIFLLLRVGDRARL